MHTKETPSTEIVNRDVEARKQLLLKLAEMYDLDDVLAQQKVDALLLNLDTLKAILVSIDYYYGLMAHRMPHNLKVELEQVGGLFLQGSDCEHQKHKYLSAGMNIFNIIAIDIESDDYQGLSDYLLNDKWHIKNWDRQV